MKKALIFIIGISIFLNFSIGSNFAAEKRDGAEHYPTPEEIQRAARPISWLST